MISNVTILVPGITRINRWCQFPSTTTTVTNCVLVLHHMWLYQDQKVVGFGDRSMGSGNFGGPNMGRPVVTNGDCGDRPNITNSIHIRSAVLPQCTEQPHRHTHSWTVTQTDRATDGWVTVLRGVEFRVFLLIFRPNRL